MNFDAHVGAAVLRKLADLADREPSPFLPSSHHLFSTAAGVLGDAKAWWEQYRTPFESFTGNLLLEQFECRKSIATDRFTSALISASFELASVARLVELRDVRVKTTYGIGIETTRGR